VFNQLYRPYEVHAAADVVSNQVFRVGQWETALDVPKTLATSCEKENKYGSHVTITWCESGNYPEFIIRGAPEPANISIVKPPVVIGLDPDEPGYAYDADIDEELVYGTACGGGPGDPFWAYDCSCSCNELVPGRDPNKPWLRFCQATGSVALTPSNQVPSPNLPIFNPNLPIFNPNLPIFNPNSGVQTGFGEFNFGPGPGVPGPGGDPEPDPGPPGLPPIPPPGPPGPIFAACNDGLDNDSDGAVDASDSGCHTDANPVNIASYNPLDDNENPAVGQCSDSRDNDRDARIDGGDPECHTDGNPLNIASYDPGRLEADRRQPPGPPAPPPLPPLPTFIPPLPTFIPQPTGGTSTSESHCDPWPCGIPRCDENGTPIPVFQDPCQNQPTSPTPTQSQPPTTQQPGGTIPPILPIVRHDVFQQLGAHGRELNECLFEGAPAPFEPSTRRHLGGTSEVRF